MEQEKPDALSPILESESQATESAPSPSPDANDIQGSPFDSIEHPFKIGEEVLLNGRMLFVQRIAENVIVLQAKDYLKSPPKGVQKKAFQLRAQFEWKGWAFEIVGIIPPQFKKKWPKKRKGQPCVPSLRVLRPFELHIKPFAIRREILGLPENETPQEREALAEAFIVPILERLNPPDEPNALKAWERGVEDFFRDVPESGNAYGSSIVLPNEDETRSYQRQYCRTFWENGWKQARDAAKAVAAGEGQPPDPPPAQSNGHDSAPESGRRATRSIIIPGEGGE